MERIQTVLDRLASGATNFATLLPGVVADPRSNPREAMPLAIIAAVLLLVTATAVMAMWDFVSLRLSDRQRGLRAKRRSRVRHAAVVATAVVLIGLVLGVAPVSRHASGACGSCHATREAVASWRAGAHAQTPCYGCHAAPGLSGALQASLSGAVARLTRVRPGSSATIDSRGCAGCHQDILGTVVGSTIRVSHRELAASGLSCVTCHRDVGHGVRERDGGIQRKAMTRCMGCHDDIQAPSTCPTCHVGNPSDRATEPSGPATPISVTCDGGCHSPVLTRQCVDCHGLVLPHPEGFVRRHAGMSARDPGMCARCHESASKTEGCACHQPGTTHGPFSEWFPVHGEAARLNGPGGCACHDKGTYSFCAKCHDRYPW